MDLDEVGEHVQVLFDHEPAVEEVMVGCGSPGSRDEGTGAEGDGVTVQEVDDMVNKLLREIRE